MKVILIKDTPKVGRKGEVKDVSDGYGNNFLIKNGFAVLATAPALEKLNKEVNAKADKKTREQERFQQYKTELEKRTFTVKVKVGDKGQVFGGVHEKDIGEAIFQKTKIQLEKAQISAHRGIKTLGQHIIEVNLGQGVKAKTKINLESL